MYIDTKELCRLLNIDRQRFRVWLSSGFIKSCIPSLGQGKRDFFTPKGAFLAAAFYHLTSVIGIKRIVAAEMLKPLYGWREKDLNTDVQLYYYIDLGTWYTKELPHNYGSRVVITVHNITYGYLKPYYKYYVV